MIPRVMHSKTRLLLFPAIAAGLLCFQLPVADARQFRTIRTIATPEKLPENAQPVERFRPVKAQIVRAAVEKLAEAWNTGTLDPLLSREKFYNKDRLLDTLAGDIPRDATLRVLSVGGITTLDQYFQPREGRRKQVNIVSAIVRTQIEFNDPNNGFIRLDGRNEFVLEVVQ